MSTHLITTAPSQTVCRKCNRVMLAATISGLDRHVDPTPVTPEGELRALLAGLATFELRGLLADLLVRRTAIHIKAGAQGPVLVEHSCHEIPDQFVERARMEAATHLVCRLLGATPVAAEGNTPPF